MIQLEAVSKRFGDKPAVDEVTYVFEPGKLTGFLGPNGAGKSTTIRMVMNILAPDEGRILAKGQALDNAFRNRVGYLAEERGLYGDMKVIDHLIFFGSLILLSVSTLQHFRSGLTFWILLTATIIYLIGTFGVTALGNVPLNDTLDVLDLSELSTNLIAKTRRQYEAPWNRLHLIRTIFGVLSFLISLLGVFAHFKA